MNHNHRQVNAPVQILCPWRSHVNYGQDQPLSSLLTLEEEEIYLS